MPYELDLLTRLITGDLSPTHFQLPEQATHRDFLRQRFTTYARHFKVQYLSPASGEFSYQRHDEFVFLELNDLPGLPLIPNGPEPRTLGLLLADTLPRLGLSLPELQDAQCHQVGEQYYLELTAACSFESLPAAKARYFYYHTQLLDEAARLRRVLPSCALMRQDGAAGVTLYVQQHQRTLQNLLAHARQQLEPTRRPGCYGTPQLYSPAEVHQLLYVELEKLLAQFEQTFPEHLNLTAPLSYRRRVQALTDVQTPLAAVLLALHSAESLPETLLGPVSECLSRLLITVQDTDLSYQDLLYPRVLLRELHSRLQRGWLLTPEGLGRLLLRYNFNTSGFFCLLKAHVRAEAEAAGEQLADQLPIIRRYLTRYRQLQPATEVLYVPTLPPLRTQLLNWLEAEYEYLSHLVQATTTPVPVASAEAARILTPLSVAQIAHLLRTLYDVGVFGQVNQRDLFRMIAANFRTARQEHISEKSLADKYYNAEESTRQAVQQLVGKMLAQLRENRKFCQ